ncbi:hypothetical protein C8R47DRAFT_1166970 [Mycena vitilis]|nr:hypothetical protein C8R47DRAFT_1166970 [Mycena vitilis]
MPGRASNPALASIQIRGLVVFGTVPAVCLGEFSQSRSVNIGVRSQVKIVGIADKLEDDHRPEWPELLPLQFYLHLPWPKLRS